MNGSGYHERLYRQAGPQRLNLGRCTRIRRWPALYRAQTEHGRAP
jgi:hypothetical protein